MDYMVYQRIQHKLTTILYHQDQDKHLDLLHMHQHIYQNPNELYLSLNKLVRIPEFFGWI